MDSPPGYADAQQVEPESSTRKTTPHIIAIDFGTTFTGVAHLHSDTINATSLKASEVAERITLVQRWPDASGAYAEKIPTILSYDSAGVVERWGASVRAEDKIKVRYFKLGLQPDAYAGSPAGLRDGFLTEFGWHNVNLNKSPLDIATDYLTEIQRHIHDEYFPSIYPTVWLKNQSFDYVITVPAIWTEKAKALTRQAAVRAGIPDASLVFTTEPEAAALYCATLCTSVDLGTGDRFLVCDVGGGTVVNFRKASFDNRISFHTRSCHRSRLKSTSVQPGLEAFAVLRFLTRTFSKCFRGSSVTKQTQY
jgi:molecular chaperone DnaK (HSP70)